MATLYVRGFNLKDSLSDAEAVGYWKFVHEEVVPAVLKVNGIRSVKFYSGAGALRADVLVQFEMDDAAAYERVLVDPGVRRLLAKVYGAWDMKTATQAFRREVTAELVRVLSSTG